MCYCLSRSIDLGIDDVHSNWRCIGLGIGKVPKSEVIRDRQQLRSTSSAKCQFSSELVTKESDRRNEWCSWGESIKESECLMAAG
jgi:hypothetical protein